MGGKVYLSQYQMGLRYLDMAVLKLVSENIRDRHCRIGRITLKEQA